MAKWNIDPDHSVAAFSVRHMMVATVRGQFNKLGGTVNLDLADPAGFTLDLTIAVAGIYTGITLRDEHLRSPDFFDVAQHPDITFRSSGFKAEGKTGGVLRGELMIHGITRPLEFKVSFLGPKKSPEGFGGETTLGIAAKSSINREDFAMIWNVPLADGGLMVGKDINIYLDIEADLRE
jgi:polyisoprenoid-binding protein YceI